MVNLHVTGFSADEDELTSISYLGDDGSEKTVSTGADVKVQTKRTITISALGASEITPSGTYDAMAKVALTVAITLYAFGTAEGAVYVAEIPEADAESVTVFVPSATGLTKTTGAYTLESNKITVSNVDYLRYEDGDIEM